MWRSRIPRTASREQWRSWPTPVIPVGIETARGLVVDRLLAAGHPVIPVHPNAFYALRPRWGAARAKNDPGDSFKLADYARTDIHRLPVLAPTLPKPSSWRR